MAHNGFKCAFEKPIDERTSSIPDEYMYPQFRRVVYAVKVLKSAASRHIEKWLIEDGASLKKSEIDYQLNALVVNSKHRYRHRGARQCMRSDRGHRYDVLFRTGEGWGTRYQIYVPEVHGVWDLDNDGKTPIKISVPRKSGSAMLEARELVTYTSDSDEYYDARVRAMCEVALREGQSVFRRRLFEAYDGRCDLTRE